MRKKNLALQVEGLTTDKIKQVSFYVREGEIVGFSGLMGSGRTELAKALYGSDKRIAGTVKICGRELGKNSNEQAVRMEWA